MIFALLLLFWVSYKISAHIMDRIKKRREILWPDYENLALQATYFHCDLGDKIQEMLDDPSTSNKDWRSLLPICKYADEWFAKTHSHLKNPSRKEDLVRSLMD